MANQYLMAVDAGTGSVRAVLFDLDGNQVGCVQKEWDHKEDPRFPGSMDFDWVFNWQLACQCIRGVIAESAVDPKEIAAVSTTCMWEGIVLYNKEGEEIWACANVDARSNDEVGQLIAMNPEMEKEIYLQSGQTYALGFDSEFDIGSCLNSDIGGLCYNRDRIGECHLNRIGLDRFARTVLDDAIQLNAVP